MIRWLLKWLWLLLAGEALAVFFGKKEVRKKVQDAQGVDKVHIMVQEIINLNKNILVEMWVEKTTLDKTEKKAIETIKGYVEQAKDTIEELKQSADQHYDDLYNKASWLLDKAKQETLDYVSDAHLDTLQKSITTVQKHLTTLKKKKQENHKKSEWQA